MKKIFIVFSFLLMGCSSISLVENWKNPDIVLFNANKVLLVGMTQSEEAREHFEEHECFLGIQETIICSLLLPLQ